MFFYSVEPVFRFSGLSKKALERLFGACIVLLACLLVLLSVIRPSHQENAIIFGTMGVLILAGTTMFLILAQMLHNEREEHGFMVYIVTFFCAFLGAVITIASESSLTGGMLPTVNGGEVLLWSSIVLSITVITVWILDGVRDIQKASTYTKSDHFQAYRYQ